MLDFLEKEENVSLALLQEVRAFRQANPLAEQLRPRIPDALEAVKQDLKALNAGVEVDQQEYDEVVAVKALFLNEDYR